MPDITADLQSIKSQISTVQSKKARAQVEYDNAVARANEAKKVLKEEFGVTTTAEANSLKLQLEEELAAEINKVREQLAEAGA